MYCLDTNIIVDFLRGDKVIIDKINNLSLEDNLFVSYISLCELFKGAYFSSKSNKEIRIIEEFLKSVEIVDFNINSCKFFGEEYVRLDRVGKKTQEFDLMIAAIAKAHNLIIITRDKKHFENIDVNVEVW